MSKRTAMREGGKIHGQVRSALYHAVKVGATPKEIEALAVKLIKEAGAETSFTKVKDYYWATCINVNHGTVHGIPESDTPFKSGDMVTVDLGVFYRGYHLDGAFTKVVGTSSPSKDKFLQAGLSALSNAIKAVKAGQRVGHISRATDQVLKETGYKAFPELTGHGVGRDLHEDPLIPNVVSDKLEDTPQLVVGQTIAIEVIYAEGEPKLILEEDGWTISTKDGKLSAVFEETVEVSPDGYSILTQPTLFELTRSGKI